MTNGQKAKVRLAVEHATKTEMRNHEQFLDSSLHLDVLTVVGAIDRALAATGNSTLTNAQGAAVRSAITLYARHIEETK